MQIWLNIWVLDGYKHSDHSDNIVLTRLLVDKVGSLVFLLTQFLQSFFAQKLAQRALFVAHLVECSPSAWRPPFNPQQWVKPDLMTQACSPSTWKVGVGGPEVQAYPRLRIEFEASLGLCELLSQKKHTRVDSQVGRDSWLTMVWGLSQLPPASCHHLLLQNLSERKNTETSPGRAAPCPLTMSTWVESKDL